MRPASRRSSHARTIAVTVLAVTVLAVTVLAVAACGSPGTTPAASTGTGASAPAASSAGAGPGGRLVVYSGRSEELVGPLLERFEAATGINTEVRYAGTSELAATILEEGANSPADVMFSQDGGALGALAAAGRLARLPDDVLGSVDKRFRAGDGSWVGVSGRARVMAYNTAAVATGDLPGSVLDLTNPAWKGRIGWVPTNASFQTFVTALRDTQGDEKTLQWLKNVQANEPKVYDGNAAALQAVAAGEVDAALVNHYYLFQAEAESGAALPVANHFFTGGDPGALVNVAGIGILDGAQNAAAADALVRFLLAEEAQAYFAEETFEYPLASGATPDPRLPSLDSVQSPNLDLSDLADLEGTLRLLQEAGVL